MRFKIQNAFFCILNRFVDMREREREREREGVSWKKLDMTFNGNRNLHGNSSVSEQMKINQILRILR